VRAWFAYAGVLSLLHPLVALSWVLDKRIALLLTTPDYVCWPLVPSCHVVRGWFSASGILVVVAGYALLGVIAAALFARERARAGMIAFVTATTFGFAIYALDYRLRSNQSYMFGWIALAFVFRTRAAAGPKRRLEMCSILIPLLYAWAGLLKTNKEWTSGAALYETPLFVPQTLVPAACVYVLVLELVLVWGLLSTDRRIRWVVYGQLVLFHLVSWKVVGFFYPLLMLGLTSVFPLIWVLCPEDTLTWKRLWGERELRQDALAVGGLLSAFQLVPRLFPGDTAITGEGRLFAVHMFDAKVECAGGATVGGSMTVELIAREEAVRMRCDPIVLRANIQHLCRKVRGARVDVAIDAKRSADEHMQPLIHVDDACHQRLAYSVLHHNAWIGAR
jgi:hypothetical protein